MNADINEIKQALLHAKNNPEKYIASRKNNKFSKVKELYGDICDLRKNNIPYDAICGILNSKGLTLTEWTLRNYMSKIKSEKAKKVKTAKH